MRFAYTEEQNDLRESVRGFLRAKADRSELRRATAPGAEHNAELWSTLANELGLTGLAVAEEHGGSGAGFVEQSIVLEETGGVLLSVPFFASAVLATTALQQSQDAAAQSRWLPGLAGGTVIGTLAHQNDDASAVTASKVDGRWSLNGAKRYVVAGEIADLILVTADTDAGVSLFAVEGAAAGLARRPLDVLDLTRRMADLEFTDVAAELIGGQGDGATTLGRTLDIAAVALSAEMLGVAQSALDMAMDYAKTRVQFDRPIGSFQAIKHKAADMFIDVESSRVLVMHAAWAVSAESDDLPELASLTLAHVSDACFRVVGQLLQILGGISYTWEHDAHFFFKRGKASGLLFGSSDAHRENVAELIGL